MSFSAFSSFLQKLTFQPFKTQLKNLSFIATINFSAFQLKNQLKNRNKHNLTIYYKNQQLKIKSAFFGR
jgi:hypothetical protein